MKHKFLIVAPMLLVLLLLSVSSVAAQEITFSGNCSIDAPMTVYEGQPFTAIFACMGLDGAYGFQLGSTIEYDGPSDAVTIPTTYNAGNFAEGGARVIGNNTIAKYAVTRTDNGSAPSPSFTLGTLNFTTTKGVLMQNAELTLSIGPGDLKIGNRDSEVIFDLDHITFSHVDIINLFSLTNLQVQSASTHVGQVSNVRVTVGSNVAENLGPVDDPVLLNFFDAIKPGINLVTADMKSHLACSSSEDFTLDIDGLTITLKPGDVNNSGKIGVGDAQIIALAFGAVPADYTGEADVDANGIVDILDMIYVGVNYDAQTSSTECVVP